jgi:hypothetical protein
MTFNRADNQADVYDKNGNLAKCVRTFDSVLQSDWTSFEVAYPDTTTEIYSFKDGDTVIKTITVVYTDATKDYIASATRS